jgi:hypothetical protein
LSFVFAAAYKTKNAVFRNRSTRMAAIFLEFPWLLRRTLQRFRWRKYSG